MPIALGIEGRILSPWEEGMANVPVVAMRPDGKELAVPYGSLGLVLWDLDPQHWLDAACGLAGRNLSQDEWDKYLSAFGEYHESCNGDRANP